MTNITLSIPDEVHKEMKQFSEVKWSEVARKAIIHKIRTLKLAEELASESKLTKHDIERLSKKVNASATKRFLNEDNS